MQERYNSNRIIEFMIIVASFIIFYIFNRILLIVPYLVAVMAFMAKRKNRQSPMVYFIIPWTFMLTMYVSKFITYTQDRDEPIAELYLISGCLLIYGGYCFARRVIFKIPNFVSEYSDVNIDCKNLKIVFNLCAICGLIGSILFVIEMIFVTGIDLSSLSMARDAYTSREVTILSQLGNIMSWGSLFVLPGVVLFGKDASVPEKALWIFSVIVYSMYSVLSAGRQVVFQILIVLVSAFTLKQSVDSQNNKNKKSNRRTIIVIVLIVGIILGYCLQVASDRNNGGISDSKLEVLSFYTGCELDPKVQVLYNLLPDGINDGIAEAFVYYTHEITGFKIFWDIDETIGPFWGLYSAPFLDRRVASLGLTTYTVDQKMSYVRNYMSSQGAMPVGWKTCFSFFILDYGRIGGLIYSFIYGFYVGYVYKNFQKKRSLISVVWLVRVNVGLFYTVMFPATCETGLLLMGIFCVIMNMLENRYKSFRYILKE